MSVEAIAVILAAIVAVLVIAGIVLVVQLLAARGDLAALRVATAEAEAESQRQRAAVAERQVGILASQSGPGGNTSAYENAAANGGELDPGDLYDRGVVLRPAGDAGDAGAGDRPGAGPGPVTMPDR